MRKYILAIAAAAVTAPAFGAGYYNMPTSLPQCLGMGFGPGYHAPMVLGPMMKAGVAAQPVRRVPAALAPPCSGFDAPAVWSDGPVVEPPVVEPWRGPLSNHASQLPAIGTSILTRASAAASSIGSSVQGIGHVGGAEVLPSPAPIGR